LPHLGSAHNCAFYFFCLNSVLRAAPLAVLQ
jgi:hypothetical protein